MAHCAGQAYVFLVQSSLFLKEVFFCCVCYFGFSLSLAFVPVFCFGSVGAMGDGVRF